MASNTLLRGILVCAVSTPEQAKEASLDQQEVDGRAFFEKEGIELLDVIKIDGYSRSFYSLHDFVTFATARGNKDAGRLERWLTEGGFDVMWVRATNRVGRKQGLVTEVIERAIETCGASIFAQLGGWINAQNYRGAGTIMSFRDASEIDELRLKRRTGMRARFRDGIPISSRVPFSHRLVKTGKSKRDVRVLVRRNVIPVIEDAARLLLEGVSYDTLEDELYRRYGHGEDGKPYTPQRFYHLFYNPVFWGNNVARWQDKASPSARGVWAFDPAEPAPDGVDVLYGTHAPALTGELARAVQAELRRRRERRHGNEKRHGAKPLSQFLVCDLCGAYYIYNVFRSGTPHLVYLRCGRTDRNRYRQHACTNRNVLQEADIIAAISEDLQTWIDAGRVAVMPPPRPDDDERERKRLKRIIRELQKRMDVLTDELVRADEDLRAHFRRQLRDAKTELDAAERQWVNIEARARREHAMTQTQTLTLQTIATMGVNTFWTLPPVEVNRMLKEVCGEFRLVANAGQVQAWAHNPHKPLPRGTATRIDAP